MPGYTIRRRIEVAEELTLAQGNTNLRPSHGGYGSEQPPPDVDTVTDLGKLPELLWKRGYVDADVRAVKRGNWVRFFSEVLPAGPNGGRLRERTEAVTPV